MISVFEHPWLSGLFGDEEVATLWSADAQIGHYRAFEAALALALAATGRVASGQGRIAADIIETASIDLVSLTHGTAGDGLPIPDFVAQLRSAAGDAQHAIHTGATSQDVLDTALALTLRDVSAVLQTRLAALQAELVDLQAAHGNAPLMGRTRMQAALPIKVADRLEAWRRPLASHMHALDDLKPMVERLQLGGAVGTRAAFGEDDEAIAEYVAGVLGLHGGPAWHTDRTALAEYAGRLATISGTLGKMGQDIALMAQQGLDEVGIAGGGVSSAMPHKSNPVLAELLVTLARFNATQVAGIHHALVHEQERSGAAWMLEWMILPQMTVTTARALAAASQLCRQIERIGSEVTAE